ncbi:MAG: 5-bromo-4-chloroindolyl phosphate hydrolysis family protein [Clostridiales bacterium]|jgi:5-bromo-4-chloroindolyl phosphate hydrolysis protein|nr:5-bromo-4-chloroindolyl phosphate hydrolysis family protein [Clostridiales bacterium]
MKKLNSVYAIYAAAAVWLLFGVIFPPFNLARFIFCAAVSILVFFIFDKYLCEHDIKEVKFKINKTGVSEADIIITKGKGFIDSLIQYNDKIDDAYISGNIDSLVSNAREIFTFVSKNPKTARKLDTFMDYYFPTALKLLNSYAEVSNSKISSAGGNVNEIKNKVRNSINMIVTAFEKQLDALYSDKFLDISTDIKVMESVLKEEL